jgi:DNA recombination protein RmuC
LTKTIFDGQQNVSKHLQFNLETLNKLNSQLGQLNESGKRIMEIGTDLRRLQEILASPKLRGGFGEWSLENILKNVLPANNFHLQHQFKDGRQVDALLEIADYSVPVDAKFPLSNFESMQQADEPTQKERLRKDFLKDVRKHIDKIAESYLRGADGTVDFALMYIPAENVYYEAIVSTAQADTNLQEYAMSKKVIPVSPNLLYVYLMTVAMGLHGLQIEQQAAQIRQNLTKLNASFTDFASTWETLGRHLRNAYSQYDEGQKKVDRFAMQLGQIQSEQSRDSDGAVT